MNRPLEIGLVAILVALAGLHLGWAFGLDWPAPKGERLAIYVTAGTRRPGRLITLAVVAAILAGAGVVVAFGAPVTGVWRGLAVPAYAGLTGVFLLRGLAGYIPAIWRGAERLPFHRLNRLYYSPLCLLIAAGLGLNAWVA